MKSGLIIKLIYTVLITNSVEHVAHLRPLISLILYICTLISCFYTSIDRSFVNINSVEYFPSEYLSGFTIET